MFTIVIALVASAGWGVSDFWGGLVARRVPVFVLILISQTLGMVAIGVILVISGDSFPGIGEVWQVSVTTPLAIIGLAAFYRAMATGTMSIVAPISATGVAVPVIFGVATGDQLQALQLIGIVAAACGAGLAGMEASEDNEQSRKARKAIALSAFAAICLGINYVGVDASADASVWWALFTGRGMELLMVAGIVVVTGASLRLSRNDMRTVVGVGVFEVVGGVCFALATTSGLLSVASVLSALYPITVVVLARVVIGERVRAIQAVGIAVTMAGVILIAAG